MSPNEIIRRASADGVTLTVTPAGKLKAAGDQTAVDRWLSVLKANKPALVAALTPLSADLELRIRAMSRR